MRLLLLILGLAACDGGTTDPFVDREAPDRALAGPGAASQFTGPPSGDVVAGDWIVCDDPACFELERFGFRLTQGLIIELDRVDRGFRERVLDHYCLGDIFGTYEVLDGGQRFRLVMDGQADDRPIAFLVGPDQARLGEKFGNPVFLQRIQTTGYVDFCVER